MSYVAPIAIGCDRPVRQSQRFLHLLRLLIQSLMGSHFPYSLMYLFICLTSLLSSFVRSRIIFTNVHSDRDDISGRNAKT